MHVVPFLGPAVLAALACLAALAASWLLAARLPGSRIPLMIAGACLAAFAVAGEWHLVASAHYYPYLAPSWPKLVQPLSLVLVGALAAGPSRPKRPVLVTLGCVLCGLVLVDHVNVALLRARMTTLRDEFEDGVTLQAESWTCVPAALSTLLRQWGLAEAQGALACRLRTTTTRGTSLRVAAGAVGEILATRGLEGLLLEHATLDELARLDVPVLLGIWAGDTPHCVALLELSPDSAVLGDPLAGRITLSPPSLESERHWTGEAIVVAPDFLHEWDLQAPAARAGSLRRALVQAGFAADASGLEAFQRTKGLPVTGRFDWRTILGLDSLMASADRPHLVPAGASVPAP